MRTINIKKVSSNTLKKASKISFGVFCLTFMVQFYICNRFAVKNDALKKSLKKSVALKKEIAQLEYENSLLSSLDSLESRAEKLGFVSMEGDLLTVAPVTVASLVNR